MDDASAKIRIDEKSTVVDGLTIRYLEAGSGHPVLMLHGASLGSSSDVFLRNMSPLAAAGFRCIAYDQPGFGLSDAPADLSTPYRRKFIPKLIDALGLGKVALFAHSQSGAMAWQLCLEPPEKYSHLVILGTGSLPPPLQEEKQGLDMAAQQRLERRMAQKEPALEDTRKLLEANLFHHELITDGELALRHSRSIGKAFEAFVARSAQEEDTPKKADKSGPELWQRVDDLKVPSILIYGKEDRANAFERVTMWKQKYPALNLHVVNGCKHLVPWDAADEVMRLCIPFMKG